jgi:single-strand DNA-binding protein
MYQKVLIIGNLGSDPEMRYMPDGTAVTNFSIATNRRWTNRATGEPQKETTWFRVSAWRQQAEFANQYLSKGQSVLVEGRLKPDLQTGGPRLWTGQDGSVRASYELTAERIQFVGGRDGAMMEDEGEEMQEGPAVQEEDEIPF